MCNDLQGETKGSAQRLSFMGDEDGEGNKEVDGKGEEEEGGGGEKQGQAWKEKTP